MPAPTHRGDSSSPDAQVTALRDQIEAISHRVVALLNQRARLVDSLLSHKRDHRLPLRDAVRERELVSRLAAASEGPLDEERIAAVFAVVFAQALAAFRDE